MRADESGEITQLMCTLGISQIAVTLTVQTLAPSGLFEDMWRGVVDLCGGLDRHKVQ